MDIASIESDACKTVRSLGFSKDRTHAIINGLSRALRDNGPEWLVSRVNNLRDYYVDAENSEFPAWIAKKRRKDGAWRPKGWLGQVVGAHTDHRSVVTLLSTVSKAVVLSEPTNKQLTKWKGAVVDPPEPVGSLTRRAGVTSPFPLNGFEDALRREWLNRPFFGPDSIGGTRIPIGFETMSIKLDKEGFPMVGDLHRAWELSLSHAPSMAWSFQDQLSPSITGLSTHQSKVLINAMRKSAPDSKSRPKTARNGRLVKRSGRPSLPNPDYPIGSISFLQQESAKLRAVANPNRFVQWQNEPLQRVLSQWVNSREGVFVLDQEAGIQWIQDQLIKGEHLTSADLSSASDTLDYKQITDLMKSDEFPLLKLSVEYFERCSSAPWALSDWKAREITDLTTVRWKQGQPLGLAPSFSLLTATNLMAAHSAVMENGGYSDSVPYAIVGDDIVIHSRYAEGYARAISALGGVANIEKSMSSDVRAEFCSRIIEKDRVYRLKPRYILDNEPQNLLTYSGTTVRPKTRGWVKGIADRVGALHLRESGQIPAYPTSAARPLPEKQVVSAVLSLSKGEALDLREVSPMTSFMHGRDSRRIDNLFGRRGPKGPQTNKFEGFDNLSAWDRSRLLADRNGGFDSLPSPSEFIAADPSALRPLRKDMDRLMDTVTRRLAYDYQFRSHFPGLKYPSLWKQNDQVLQNMVGDVARVQRVNSRTVYDHHTDERMVPERPVTSLKKLSRKTDAILGDVIRDGDKAHMMTESSEGLLTTLEDKGDHYDLTFSKGSKESTPVIIPKDDDSRPKPNSQTSRIRSRFPELYDSRESQSKDDGFEPGY